MAYIFKEDSIEISKVCTSWILYYDFGITNRGRVEVDTNRLGLFAVLFDHATDVKSGSPSLVGNDDPSTKDYELLANHGGSIKIKHSRLIRRVRVEYSNETQEMFVFRLDARQDERAKEMDKPRTWFDVNSVGWVTANDYQKILDEEANKPDGISGLKEHKISYPGIQNHPVDAVYDESFGEEEQFTKLGIVKKFYGRETLLMELLKDANTEELDASNSIQTLSVEGIGDSRTSIDFFKNTFDDGANPLDGFVMVAEGAFKQPLIERSFFSQLSTKGNADADTVIAMWHEWIVAAAGDLTGPANNPSSGFRAVDTKFSRRLETSDVTFGDSAYTSQSAPIEVAFFDARNRFLKK